MLLLVVRKLLYVRPSILENSLKSAPSPNVIVERAFPFKEADASLLQERPDGNGKTARGDAPSHTSDRTDRRAVSLTSYNDGIFDPREEYAECLDNMRRQKSGESAKEFGLRVEKLAMELYQSMTEGREHTAKQKNRTRHNTELSVRKFPTRITRENADDRAIKELFQPHSSYVRPNSRREANRTRCISGKYRPKP